MRRFVRITLRSLSFLSLSVCLLVVVLWIRGSSREEFSAWDRLAFEWGGERWEICSGMGRLAINNDPQIELELDRMGTLTDQSRQLNEHARELMAVLDADRNMDATKVDGIQKQIDGDLKEARRLADLRDMLFRQPQRPLVVYEVRNWIVVSCAAVLPTIYFPWWWLSWRRQRLRRIGGLCLCCGYDLRSSKERCPECGTAIASSAEEDRHEATPSRTPTFAGRRRPGFFTRR